MFTGWLYCLRLINRK